MALCEVYMVVGLAFKYEDHVQIYIYHALTKEVIWKFKTKEKVKCFAIKASSCKNEQKLEVSAQTR